jgi:hypothetical protein
MCLSTIAKKAASIFLVAGCLVWLTGCGDASSTPKPKLRSDGSVTSSDSQAGSTTGKGRNVPDAAPAADDADAKPADESAGDKPADEKEVE